MDYTSITSSPTFCPAPWTSLNIDQAGRVSPCFYSSTIGNIKENSTIQEVITGEEWTKLKTSMAQGQWHKSCSWCKRLEDTTGSSGRTVRIIDKDTQESINADINFFKLEHLVVNWSNLCNLSCVYCNAETSTAWQSIKKIPINHVKNEHQDLIELARTQGHNIQGLSLGGGEPLLQKGLDVFLGYLNPEKVNVMVTTNLSIDITKNPIYNILRTWPHVSWMISFDNADKHKFEYVRNGANWELFVQNIHQMKQDQQHVQAHPAYSIYCAWDLIEYYDFCVAENLDIFWCELTHPKELDIRQYSQAVKQRAVDEIDQVVEKYKNKSGLDLDTLKRYKLTLLDPSYTDKGPVFRLDNTFGTFDPSETIAWHQQMEKTLKKSQTFEQLWPELAKQL